MTKLKPGDKIDCLIKNGTIAHPSWDGFSFETVLTFEIVAAVDYGYYVFVPEYYPIKDTIIINEARCRKHDIHPRFLYEQMTHITDSLVYKVRSQMDGMCCRGCDDFILMGASNQPDGTLLCYTCRRNPYL